MSDDGCAQRKDDDAVRILKENKYQKTHNQIKGCSRLVTTIRVCSTKRLNVKCNMAND